MATTLAPNVEWFDDDSEIWAMINSTPYLKQQFNEPDILNSSVCVVAGIVYRKPHYMQHELDLDVFIKYPLITESGQLELYRIRDFIRQRVDIGPVVAAVQIITKIDVKQFLDLVKAQIKFLQRPENSDLPAAPAQMLRIYQ